jgi:hypothetical protein
LLLVAIPTPEPGLVLNFAYLWHREHQAGQEEGRKDRPSVIVLCVRRENDGGALVTVLPIMLDIARRQLIGSLTTSCGEG